MKALLDTHAAVLLADGEAVSFGSASRAVLDDAELLLSPVTRLELEYLFEIKRISTPPDFVIGALEADLAVRLTEDPISAVIGRAIHIRWTRDVFDRLLVATAQLHGARFITRDRRIRDHFDRAVW